MTEVEFDTTEESMEFLETFISEWIDDENDGFVMLNGCQVMLDCSLYQSYISFVSMLNGCLPISFIWYC